MTDYFTRLAERTLGAAPVPRPVIASRFERPAATGLEEIELEEVAITSATAARSVGAAPTTAAVHAPTTDGAPTSAPVPAPLVVARPDPERAVPQPDSPVHRDERQSPRPAAERVVTHERDRLVVEHETVIATPAAEAARAPIARPPVVTHRLETRPAPPMPAPARSVTPEPRREASDELVVHVTIGRVDVRAITSSAPSPARERPHLQRPPRPSLEDYLRRGGDQP